MKKTILTATALAATLWQAPAMAQTESTDAGTMETTYEREEDGMDWGWLGLLGLAGLAGLRRRDHHHTTTTHTPRT